MTSLPTLDHIVVDVRDKMDEATSVFRALGYQLTPLGRHSLGTINHLAVFGDNYLELLGYEPGATDIRADVVDYPPGLNGLVFGTVDSGATYESMRARGVPIQEPVPFFRPVELSNGIKEDAHFRTVRLPRGTIPGVRAYFCHHLTRHLVWRDEWQHHANGTLNIARLLLASADPEASAAIFAKMFGAAAIQTGPHGLSLLMSNAVLDIVTHDTAKQRFGDALAAADGRTDFLAAIVLKTATPAKLKDVLGSVLSAREGRMVVPARLACNVALEFVA